MQSLSAVIAASSEDTAKSVSGICSDSGIKSITLTNGENVRSFAPKTAMTLLCSFSPLRNASERKLPFISAKAKAHR